MYSAGFGLVSLIRPQNAFSDNENRSLEQYPEWKLQGVLDGSFQQDFDNAFSDQFAGRDSWMGFSTSVEKLLGFRDIGDVYLGKTITILQRQHKKISTRKITYKIFVM